MRLREILNLQRSAVFALAFAFALLGSAQYYEEHTKESEGPGPCDPTDPDCFTCPDCDHPIPGEPCNPLEPSCAEPCDPTDPNCDQLNQIGRAHV